MMEKTLLKITIDDKNNVTTELPDPDLAVMALTDTIWEQLMNRDTKPLSYLFAVVAHIMSRDFSGNLQKDFLENLDRVVPEYTKKLKKACEELNNEQNLS